MKSKSRTKHHHFIYAKLPILILSIYAGSSVLLPINQSALGKPQFFSVKAKEDPSEKLLETGRKLFLAGQFQGACEVFRQAVDKNPESAVNHFEYARTLARLDNDDKAISEFLEALNRDPALIDSRKEMAAIFMNFFL